jgi:hypothetical protein
MSNIPEEAGKVATTAIDAFRNNPACLAAILLAAGFGVLTFYGLQRDADRRSKTADILISKCIPYVGELQRESHPPRDESGP